MKPAVLVLATGMLAAQCVVWNQSVDADTAWMTMQKTQVPLQTKSQAILRGLKFYGTDTNGAALYVCRANFSTKPHPGKHLGKIRADFTDGCHISYGGYEYAITPFDILMKDSTFTWVDYDVNANPPITAPHETMVLTDGSEGPDEVNGPNQPLTACQTTDGLHGTQLGKFRSGFKDCLYPYGGLETLASTFKVMALP